MLKAHQRPSIITSSDQQFVTVVQFMFAHMHIFQFLKKIYFEQYDYLKNTNVYLHIIKQFEKFEFATIV